MRPSGRVSGGVCVGGTVSGKDSGPREPSPWRAGQKAGTERPCGDCPTPRVWLPGALPGTKARDTPPPRVLTAPSPGSRRPPPPAPNPELRRPPPRFHTSAWHLYLLPTVQRASETRRTGRAGDTPDSNTGSPESAREQHPKEGRPGGYVGSSAEALGLEAHSRRGGPVRRPRAKPEAEPEGQVRTLGPRPPALGQWPRAALSRDRAPGAATPRAGMARRGLGTGGPGDRPGNPGRHDVERRPRLGPRGSSAAAELEF